MKILYNILYACLLYWKHSRKSEALKNDSIFFHRRILCPNFCRYIHNSYIVQLSLLISSGRAIQICLWPLWAHETCITFLHEPNNTFPNKCFYCDHDAWPNVDIYKIFFICRIWFRTKTSDYYHLLWQILNGVKRNNVRLPLAESDPSISLLHDWTKAFQLNWPSLSSGPI